jgi:DNA-binding HxlR family transcriptional regulator
MHPMQRTDFGRMNCSIARAIDILGEPWTPLILRDLLLGFTQFDEMQRDLGVSTNILADRLRRLTTDGVIERRRYGAHPKRYEYRLTDKGRDAVPILLALVAWGDRWEAGGAGPPTDIIHTRCGKPTAAVAHCGACGRKLEQSELVYRNGRGAETAPGTLLLREKLRGRRR